MKIQQVVKSKTIDGNIAIGAIITILKQFGVELSPEWISLIFGVANIIFRFITKVPLSEK